MATTRVTRKGDLTSQPPDTPLGVSEVETIVEKAVKAAVQVVRDFKSFMITWLNV